MWHTDCRDQTNYITFYNFAYAQNTFIEEYFQRKLKR